MSTEKYVNAIQFLSSRLSCKINRFHSVRVGREVVQNVLVLNREQHSLYGLFDQYKDTYPDNARLGRNNFCEVVQLLSQKSEVMAGLSIYLVDFLYISKYIREVLARYSELIDMDTVLSAESNILGPKSAQLLERWEELFVFLRLRYGTLTSGRILRLQTTRVDLFWRRAVQFLKVELSIGMHADHATIYFCSLYHFRDFSN